jgi:hypothetical protein
MNDVYFACEDCRVLLNAGYRWAMALPGLPGFRDARGQVCVDVVMAAAEYWNAPHDPDSQWLRDEVLPSVHAFLAAHRTHRIDFGDFDYLGSESALDWLQIGYWPEPTPRYFAEVLKLRSWSQVTDWLRTLDEQRHCLPTWLHDPKALVEARKRFEALVGI